MLDEAHPNHCGLYGGAASSPAAAAALVEASDCLLLVGLGVV